MVARRGDTDMPLTKTDHGHAALQAHAASGLSLAERRVLILSDGRRNRDDLVALLGQDARPMIERLLQDGYLTLATGTPVSRPAGAPVPPPIAAPVPAPIPPPPRVAESRRSLAASKMYLLDMLQLQRHPDAASLRAEIQTSPSDDELVYRMMKALDVLQHVANPGYAQRVGERLGEILPERYVARLQQAREARPVPASAVA